MATKLTTFVKETKKYDVDPSTITKKDSTLSVQQVRTFKEDTKETDSVSVRSLRDLLSQRQPQQENTRNLSENDLRAYVSVLRCVFSPVRANLNWKISSEKVFDLVKMTFQIDEAQHASIWDNLLMEDYDVGYVDLLVRRSLVDNHPSFYSRDYFKDEQHFLAWRSEQQQKTQSLMHTLEKELATPFRAKIKISHVEFTDLKLKLADSNDIYCKIKFKKTKLKTASHKVSSGVFFEENIALEINDTQGTIEIVLAKKGLKHTNIAVAQLPVEDLLRKTGWRKGLTWDVRSLVFTLDCSIPGKSGQIGKVLIVLNFAFRKRLRMADAEFEAIKKNKMNLFDYADILKSVVLNILNHHHEEGSHERTAETLSENSSNALFSPEEEWLLNEFCLRYSLCIVYQKIALLDAFTKRLDLIQPHFQEFGETVDLLYWFILRNPDDMRPKDKQLLRGMIEILLEKVRSILSDFKLYFRKNRPAGALSTLVDTCRMLLVSTATTSEQCEVSPSVQRQWAKLQLRLEKLQSRDSISSDGSEKAEDSETTETNNCGPCKRTDDNDEENFADSSDNEVDSEDFGDDAEDLMHKMHTCDISIVQGYIKEAIHSDYERIYDELVADDSVPGTEDDHQAHTKMVNVCKKVVRRINEDNSTFSDAFPEEMRYIQISASQYYQEFTHDVRRMLENVGENAKSEVTPTSIVELALEIQFLNSQMSDLSVAISLEHFLDPAEIMSPILMRWIDSTALKFKDWIGKAILLDNWQPISTDLLHSSSVVDMFSLCIQPLQFVKSIDVDISPVLFRAVEVICSTILEYVDQLVGTCEHDFIVQQDTGPGIGDSSPSATEPIIPHLTVPMEILVKANNLEAIRQQLNRIIEDSIGTKNRFFEDQKLSRSSSSSSLTSSVSTFSATSSTASKCVMGDFSRLSKSVFRRLHLQLDKMMNMIATELRQATHTSFYYIVEIEELQSENPMEEDASSRDAVLRRVGTEAQARLDRIMAYTGEYLHSFSDVLYRDIFLKLLSKIHSSFAKTMEDILLPSTTRHNGLTTSQVCVLESLVDHLNSFFHSDGEGIPKERAEANTTLLRMLLEYHCMSTSDLIKYYNAFALDRKREEISPIKAFHITGIILTRRDEQADTFGRAHPDYYYNMDILSRFRIPITEDNQVIEQFTVLENEVKGTLYVCTKHVLWESSLKSRQIVIGISHITGLKLYESKALGKGIILTVLNDDERSSSYTFYRLQKRDVLYFEIFTCVRSYLEQERGQEATGREKNVSTFSSDDSSSDDCSDDPSLSVTTTLECSRHSSILPACVESQRHMCDHRTELINELIVQGSTNKQSLELIDKFGLPHETEVLLDEFPCSLIEKSCSIKGTVYVFSSFVCFEGRQTCGDGQRLLVQPIAEITYISKDNVAQKATPLTILNKRQELCYFANISPDRDSLFRRIVVQAEFWGLRWCKYATSARTRELAELHTKMGFKVEIGQFSEDALKSSLGLTNVGRLLDYFLCHNNPNRDSPDSSPREGRAKAEICGMLLVFSATLSWSTCMDTTNAIQHVMPFEMIKQIRKESGHRIAITMKTGMEFGFGFDIARDPSFEIIQKAFQTCVKQLEKGIDVSEQAIDVQSLASASEKEKVICQGVLKKCGERYIFKSNAYKSRTFVLTRSCLRYYKGNKLRGAIPISKVIKLDADPPKKLKNYFGINLHTSNRTYELFALNESDFIMWLLHLNGVLSTEGRNKRVKK